MCHIFTAIITVLFEKNFSFNNFTVFLEFHIHAVAGWHKAQMDAGGYHMT